MTKNREKNEKIIFGSELSAPNNEPTLRWQQKNWQKIEKNIRKLFLAQNGLKKIMSQLLDYTKKLRIFLAQNCLKRIMSQLLEYTKKWQKIEKKKSRKIIFGSELFEPNNKPNFRLYQKLTKIEKKIEKLFLVQNFLKQKMN